MTPCPCGRPDFARCCGPYLEDFDGQPAPDAEALMRSRYSAFVLEKGDYLLATWHASTRPGEIAFEPGLKWLGLEVRDARQRDADHAEVEFVARSRLAGRGHPAARAQPLRARRRPLVLRGWGLEVNQRFDAVLFDCDGVLVDSEGITNGVLRAMLEELGWKLSREECMRLFVGKAVKDEQALIEAKIGKPLAEEWFVRFRERRNEGLVARVQAVPNAVAVVAQLSERLQGRIACCSGADRFKVELQLRKCGLMDYFEGRVFSGHEMPRSKPFPDVYLAGMERLGVAPGRCAVVEDTVTGVRAGVAAGATVFGYSPPEAGHDAPAALLAAGAATTFVDMAQLPRLLG